jgi:hypothetical protein
MFGARSFRQQAVLPTYHFVNLPFCQLLNLPFNELVANLPISQVAIWSTYQSVNLPFCQLAISSTALKNILCLYKMAS